MEDRVDILQYLDESLSTFDDNPADSDYQQGYLAALEEMFDFFNEG
jgi:hypothetical protein